MTCKPAVSKLFMETSETAAVYLGIDIVMDDDSRVRQETFWFRMILPNILQWNPDASIEYMPLNAVC